MTLASRRRGPAWLRLTLFGTRTEVASQTLPVLPGGLSSGQVRWRGPESLVPGLRNLHAWGLSGWV